MKYIDQTVVRKMMGKRAMKNRFFQTLFFVSTIFALVVLAILLYRIFTQGISYVTPEFFQNFASRRASASGIKAALVGSIWVMGVVIPISLLLGVGTAIYLEEYAKKINLQILFRRIFRIWRVSHLLFLVCWGLQYLFGEWI